MPLLLDMGYFAKVSLVATRLPLSMIWRLIFGNYAA
jgi:hypothetical protein